MSRLRRAVDDQSGFTLVELMVVLVLTSIVAGITLVTVMNVNRSEQFQDEYTRVMDDGRVSIDRIRRELREGRRVLDGSTAQHLYWWADRNQDGLQQPDERIHYCVASLTSNTCLTTVQTGTFRLIRWSDAETNADARTIAATLVSSDVFSGLEAPVTGTRVVDMTFVLDVQEGGRGPQDITMQTAVRLRNVA
jgi:prepilin-type N-terminal cleavage/methylation domain-containing protein